MSRYIRHKKKDANHGEIVEYLRSQGCTVDDVSGLAGLGYDLIVGFAGQMAAAEVKDGAKPPSSRALTESELSAREKWGSLYFVVTSTVDCDVMLGELRGIAR